MDHIVTLILLFWITCNKIAVGIIDIQSIHDDLQKVRSCSHDKCPTSDDVFLSNYKCRCDAKCVEFDNCCLNSSYVGVSNAQIKYTCTSVDKGRAYFMIDHCPTSNSIWENLCRSGWDSDDDLIKILPVTSTMTSITYKNIFCFRCHEVNDEYFHWLVHLNVKDGSRYTKPGEELIIHRYSLIYFTPSNSYVKLGRKGLTPVTVSFRIPEGKDYSLIKQCDSNIISKCANDWTNSEISEKCQAYMGMRTIAKTFPPVVYKNLHCALCNYEKLNDIRCDISAYYSSDTPSFSADYIIDISLSGGEKVGETEKCDDEHIWSDEEEKCRILTCALPGYKPNKESGICERK